MSRLLLFVSLAGLVLTLWSFLSVLDRPISFELLRGEVAKAAADREFSPEEHKMIEFRIEELRLAHLSYARRREDALLISWAGLLGVSSCCMVAYVLRRRFA